MREKGEGVRDERGEVEGGKMLCAGGGVTEQG